MGFLSSAKIEVYEVFQGKITIWNLVKETPQGYRVVLPERYERVIPRLKVYANKKGTKEFNTKKSFLLYGDALAWASHQIISMKTYHESELELIKRLEEKTRELWR